MRVVRGIRVHHLLRGGGEVDGGGNAKKKAFLCVRVHEGLKHVLLLLVVLLFCLDFDAGFSYSLVLSTRPDDFVGDIDTWCVCMIVCYTLLSLSLSLSLSLLR